MVGQVLPILESLTDQMHESDAKILVNDLVSYQMQRAAINGHWDALRVMAEVHKDNPSLLTDAIMYTHNNEDLALKMYRLYRDLIPDAGRDYSIIDYYDSIENRRDIESISARLRNSEETEALLPEYMMMVTPEVARQSGISTAIMKRNGIFSDMDDVEVLLYKDYDQNESEEYSFWDDIWESMNSRPQNMYNLANAIGDMYEPGITNERYDFFKLTTKMKFFNKAALDKIKDIGATIYEVFIDERGVSHGNPPPIVFKYLINQFDPEYRERMAQNGPVYALIYKQFKGENINLRDLL